MSTKKKAKKHVTVSVDRLHSFLDTTSRSAASVKKVKSKESREVQRLFENIAKDLVIANFGECKNDLEIFCRGLVNKVFSEIRDEIASIESTNATRYQLIEAKITNTNSRIDTMIAEQNSNAQVKKLQEELTKAQADFKAALEHERAKRQTLTKKMMAADEKNAEDFKKMFLANKDEQNTLTVQMTNDLNSQSKEVSKIKESIEELLIKRYGFLPGTRSSSDNMTASFNQGLDAGLVLDNLTNRIKDLETTLDKGPHHRYSSSAAGASASAPPPLPSYRNSVAANGVLNKKMEENIYDLRAQLRECEAEVQGLKATLKNFVKKYDSSAEAISHRREINDMINESFANHDTNVVEAHELKSLQKKVKKLAENTTRACRSLSTGLSDVQQATLNLYSWSDKAHDALGTISNKLGYAVNQCPRAKVYNPPRADQFEI